MLRDDSPDTAIVAALCHSSRATPPPPKNHSEPVTNGFWFRRNVTNQRPITRGNQRNVANFVRLKLYKGSVIVAGRKESQEHSTIRRSPSMEGEDLGGGV